MYVPPRPTGIGPRQPEGPDEEPEGLYACVTCGENAPRFGARCERCKRNMEEDRYERESGR
jgi:hypothetical protein